jgi:class 3 adenylate cyclase
LLKDKVAEGDQLARAIREVTTGGSVIDPTIVEAMVNPVSQNGDLSADEEELLRYIGEGKPMKAIAAARKTTPEAVSDDVEKLFLKLAEGATHGETGALRRLRMLHQAIVEREEQGETLSRLLPGGLAERLNREGHKIGSTETLTVTVLMSDIRGYSSIAETADPSVLAGQLNEHRAAMSRSLISNGGTVMQFVGDAAMGVFGAPIARTDHADRAIEAADSMHRAQQEINESWEGRGLPSFHLGIGISTGEVAAALLGSEERLEYTMVGDSVNLAQRLQQWAKGGQTVLTEATVTALSQSLEATKLEPRLVKGRNAVVTGYLIDHLAEKKVRKLK